MKALFCCLVVVGALTVVQPAAAEDPLLNGSLTALEGWIGTWRIDGHWSDGRALWSEAQYRPLLGGAFLEGVVVVRDDGGEPYLRYRTIFFGGDSTGSVTMHTFAADGSYSESSLLVEGPRATTEWMAGSNRVVEQMDLEDDGAFLRWQVWMHGAGGEQTPLMNDVWQRVEGRSVPMPQAERLAPEVSELEPFLGGWEISGEWADGRRLWARSDFRSGIGGRFVDSSAWTLMNEGTPYQQYEAIFVPAAEGGPGSVISFAADGSISRAELVFGDHEGFSGFVVEADFTGTDRVRQVVNFESTTVFRWQVARRQTSDESWTEMIDGRWQRQGAPDHAFHGGIDVQRFVASGSDVRSFVVEREMPAPAAEVYDLWTTDSGWSKVWRSPGASRIELAIGGRYEWMFNGWLGSNGCQVLSYIPDRMLSFSWNAPPSQPDNRLARTWVVVELTPIDGGETLVRLTHLGFGEGEAWDETQTYFENAWVHVLDLMAKTVRPSETEGSR